MNRTLILFALLGISLSGCTDTPDNDSVTIIESPTDFSYLTENSTATAHIHDYWGGADRLVILEETQVKEETSGQFGSNYRPYQFYPEPGFVIPQGTASVEVTIDFENAYEELHYPPHLVYKTADQRDWIDAGEFVVGETMVLESTNKDNDIPHQRLSAWAFAIQTEASGPGPYSKQLGSATMHVEAVKGLEIPEFPAHPERWSGSTEIQVFDFETDFTYTQVGDPEMFASGASIATPIDGAVVPFDTSYVRAKLTLKDDGTLSNFGNLDLLYHGADSREWTRLEHDSEDGLTRTYIIDVDGSADSPYAEVSLWEFYVTGDGEYSSYSYEIQATAFKHDAPF